MASLFSWCFILWVWRRGIDLRTTQTFFSFSPACIMGKLAIMVCGVGRKKWKRAKGREEQAQVLWLMEQHSADDRLTGCRSYMDHCLNRFEFPAPVFLGQLTLKFANHTDAYIFISHHNLAFLLPAGVATYIRWQGKRVKVGKKGLIKFRK